MAGYCFLRRLMLQSFWICYGFTSMEGGETSGRNYNGMRMQKVPTLIHMRDNRQRRRLLLSRLMLLLFVFTIPSFSLTQERYPTSESADSSTSQPADTTSTASQNHGSSDDDVLPRPYALKLWRSLNGHLHNKLIHVPIGFGLSAFFLSLLSLRWREYEPGVRWLVVLAALGSVAAYLTGSQQAVSLEGGSKDWVISLHRTLGILTMTSLCVWAIVLWLPRIKRWSIFAAILSCGLLLVTGFFGGILAHG